MLVDIGFLPVETDFIVMVHLPLLITVQKYKLKSRKVCTIIILHIFTIG